jgi:hypothetical protein
MSESTAEIQFATIPRWCKISGMSTRSTYRALAAGSLEAFKVGASSLIDVQKGLAWIRSQPKATYAKPVMRE